MAILLARILAGPIINGAAALLTWAIIKSGKKSGSKAIDVSQIMTDCMQDVERTYDRKSPEFNSALNACYQAKLKGKPWYPSKHAH
jgi:hypothetical protein